MRVRFLAMAVAVTAWLGSPVLAQGWVAFLHTPPDVQHADADLVLGGSLVGAGPGDRVEVRYRHPGDPVWRAVPVKPVYGDTYQAVIPAAQVRPPAVEYYVVWIHDDGPAQAIFASRTQPQRVRVVTGNLARARPPRASRAPPKAKAGAAATRAAIPVPTFAPVAATRLATLTSQSVDRAPAVVSVITGRQMQEMGARTLVDVLKTIPGLETSRDVQGFWRLAVRGIRSDPEVLLLYDGHRLSNLYDGRNLYELPVENLARVEIIRGPGAALYGGGAFLAVINVIPSSRLGVQLAEDLDTFGVDGGHLGWGVRVGRGGLIRADADVQGGQGYSQPVLHDAYHATNTAPIGRTDDRHLLADAGLRGRHPVGPGLLTWSLRGFWQDRAALIGAFDTLGPASHLTWLMGLGDVAYTLPAGSGEVVFRLSGDYQRTDRLFQLSPAPFTTAAGQAFPQGVLERTRTGTRQVGGSVLGRFPLFAGNRLTTGAELSVQALNFFSYGVNFDPSTGDPLAKTTVPAGVVFPADDPGLTQRLALGVFLQDAWVLVPGLELTAGLRGDLFSGGVGRDDPAAKVGTAGTAFALDPRLALVWQPTSAWSLKVLYGTAFRVPTFEELTSVVVQGGYSRGRFVGSSTLQPVHTRTVEVAAEHTFDGFEHHRVHLEVNGFFNQFQGRIEAIDLTGNVTPLTNRAETRVFGVEGKGRIDLSPRDRISAAMAWFRGLDTQAPPGKDLLTDVPQLRFILEAQLALSGMFDLHLGATFGAERRNDARSQLEALRRFSIPAYALLDATLITRPVARHFTFALTLENLLDSTYLDAVPRPDRITGLLPGPGLSARFTARARW